MIGLSYEKFSFQLLTAQNTYAAAGRGLQRRNGMSQAISGLVWILSFICAFCSGYYLLLALFGFKKPREYPESAPKTRFAVLIAARNEQCVIGNLVESLREQDYPRELFDIIVIPNNCTDRTAEVAREKGAEILECLQPVRSKGDVLRHAFERLSEFGDYDAVCVFDADNLAHSDFLKEMNNAFCDGVRVAQGYRDSKNPGDTFISGCYSIYYWMLNRFFSGARPAAGLSSVINGSGFMLSTALVEKLGGWNTETMTEDLEITTLCVLAGERVEWVRKAVTYDEQPLTFSQSWRQRRRWTSGMMQAFVKFLPKLLWGLIKERKRVYFDQIMFYMGPVVQIFCVASLLLTAALDMLYVRNNVFPLALVSYKLFVSVNVSYLMSVAFAMIIVLSEKKNPLRMARSIAAYWLFVITWMPISVVCLFSRDKAWDEIRHTRSMKIREMS